VTRITTTRTDKELIVAPTAEGRLIRSQPRRSANRVNYRARDSDDFVAAVAVTEIAQMTAMTKARERERERERERGCVHSGRFIAAHYRHRDRSVTPLLPNRKRGPEDNYSNGIIFWKIYR